MPLAATRKQVHDAIVSQLQTLFSSRPIFPRTRRAPQNTEGQNISLFNDNAGILNFIVARYIGLQREVAGVPLETISKTYVFEIEVRRAVNERDVDDDASASETLFNADLDLIENLFQDTNLGLDPAVTTPGFVILQPIPRDGEPFNAKLTHVARGALVVQVGECGEDDEI